MLLDLQRKSYRIFHIPCSGLLASVFGKISHRSRAQPHRINMTILVKAKRQFYADVWKGMNPFFDVRSYYRHTDTQLTSWGSMSSTHASAAGGCSSSPPSASSVFSTREAVAVPSEPAAACASNHHGSIININLFESCWAANSTWLGHVNHAWRSTKRCETRWSCQSSNWAACLRLWPQHLSRTESKNHPVNVGGQSPQTMIDGWSRNVKDMRLCTGLAAAISRDFSGWMTKPPTSDRGTMENIWIEIHICRETRESVTRTANENRTANASFPSTFTPQIFEFL